MFVAWRPAFRTDDFELAAFEPGQVMPTPLGQPPRSNGGTCGQARLVKGECDGDRPGGRVTGVETPSGGEADRRQRCRCMGGRGRLWARPPITTWKHDTAFLRRPKDLGPSHPTVIDFINLMYFRPETGGLTLIGLEDGNPLGLSPDTGGDQPEADFVERAVDRICRRVPGMDRGSLQSAHAGYDGLTPDQRAILDQAGPDGFFVVCGFSGTGFKIAPAVGACMAEWIVDGRASSVDISAFTLKRFAEGRRLTGEHAYGEIWR
jgi:sarcosine oxidase subunit beta